MTDQVGPPSLPSQVTAQAKPAGWYCGADLGEGRTCRRRAGHGTDHLGVGTCKYHLGSTANHRKHAALEMGRREAARLSELRHREVGPHEALLEEVHRTAGMVSFLEEYLAAGSTEDLTQLDLSGRFERPSVWYELYERERRHIIDAAKACVTAGVEERQVAVAEAQGRLLAGAVRRSFERAWEALRAAGVAPDILERVAADALPEIVRSELLALSAGAADVVDATATEAAPVADAEPSEGA